MCKTTIPQPLEAPNKFDSSTNTAEAAADRSKVISTKAAKRSKKAAPAVGEEAADKVIADRFRTRLCRNFVEKGSCPYESRCMFAHGERQLRSKEMNLQDGLVSEEAIKQFKKLMQQKSRKPASSTVGGWTRPAVGATPCREHDGAARVPFCGTRACCDWPLEVTSVASSPCNLTSSSSDSDEEELPRRSSCYSVVEYVSPNTFRFNPYGVAVAA